MAYVPSDPQEFLSFVAGILRRFSPDARIVADLDFGLVVDGSCIDLSQLQRAIADRPKRGRWFVVQFAQKLAEARRLISGLGQSWEFWRDRIVPRIVLRSTIPPSELPFLVARPLTQELMVMAAYDLPTAVVPLSLIQVLNWEQESDAVIDEAGENLRAMAKLLNLKASQAPDGTRVVWAERTNPHNAALLAIPGLHSLLSGLVGVQPSEKGVTFGVCVPTRESFFAHTPVRSGAAERLKQTMLKRTASLPFQLSDQTISVTSDGIIDTAA